MTTDTTITTGLLDQLLANYTKPEDLTGENGLFKQLKKALIERALGAELRSDVTSGLSDCISGVAITSGEVCVLATQSLAQSEKPLISTSLPAW
jgi:hypothetical protein